MSNIKKKICEKRNKLKEYQTVSFKVHELK